MEVEGARLRAAGSPRLVDRRPEILERRNDVRLPARARRASRIAKPFGPLQRNVGVRLVPYAARVVQDDVVPPVDGAGQVRGQHATEGLDPGRAGLGVETGERFPKEIGE